MDEASFRTPPRGISRTYSEDEEVDTSGASSLSPSAPPSLDGGDGARGPGLFLDVLQANISTHPDDTLEFLARLSPQRCPRDHHHHHHPQTPSQQTPSHQSPLLVLPEFSMPRFMQSPVQSPSGEPEHNQLSFSSPASIKQAVQQLQLPTKAQAQQQHVQWLSQQHPQQQEEGGRCSPPGTPPQEPQHQRVHTWSHPGKDTPSLHAPHSLL